MKKLSNFATEIRIAHIRCGKTQCDIAKYIGVTASMIHLVETRTVNVPKYIIKGYQRFFDAEGVSVPKLDSLLKQHSEFVSRNKHTS